MGVIIIQQAREHTPPARVVSLVCNGKVGVIERQWEQKQPVSVRDWCGLGQCPLPQIAHAQNSSCESGCACGGNMTVKFSTRVNSLPNRGAFAFLGPLRIRQAKWRLPGLIYLPC